MNKEVKFMFFYKKKNYCKDAPTFDRSSWLKEKETLGLDFPNVFIIYYLLFF